MEGQLYLLTYGNESRGGAWRAEDDQFHIAALEFLRGRKNETWRNLVNISRSRLARLEGFLLGAVVSGRGRLFCFRINGRSALGLQPAGPNVISVSELSRFISSPVFELLTSAPATLTARVCFLPLQLPKPCRMIY